jgi:LysM repeat protein
VDPRRREQLTRYGAPAAFLAAVTIAAILVKAGLNGSSSTTVAITSSSTARTTTAATTTTKLVLTAPPGSTTTETTTPGAEYYVVVSGDTLGSIAQKYNTTVDELTTLNLGIDPTALTVGQKIRIK